VTQDNKRISRKNTYIDRDKFPKGFVRLPVKMNGKGHETEAAMIAWSLAVLHTSSGQISAAATIFQHRNYVDIPSAVGLDTVSAAGRVFHLRVARVELPGPFL